MTNAPEKYAAIKERIKPEGKEVSDEYVDKIKPHKCTLGFVTIVIFRSVGNVECSTSELRFAM